MIEYEAAGFNHIFNLFKMKGSVFPYAAKIALPAGVISFALKMLLKERAFEYFFNINVNDDTYSIVSNPATWSGFNFLVGFLIVFRTSQAYNRFWEGCSATHLMFAEWFDAASAIVAFCKYSTADDVEIVRFQHTLIRLFSMLHAVALSEIEDVSVEDSPSADCAAFKLELIDAKGIDPDSLKAIKDSPEKVALIFQWIQQLVVENISTGVLSVPPPILSRAFQEIANGMVAFHEAMKIADIPFPFPYAQTCDCLLLMHWIITPFVISQWTSAPVWAFLFSTIQVFVLWSLNAIALEIEQPFGGDANDIDAERMQHLMNEHLLLLLRPCTAMTPQLSEHAKLEEVGEGCMEESFYDVWQRLEKQEAAGALRAVNNSVSMRNSIEVRRSFKTSQASVYSATSPRHRASKQSMQHRSLRAGGEAEYPSGIASITSGNHQKSQSSSPKSNINDASVAAKNVVLPLGGLKLIDEPDLAKVQLAIIVAAEGEENTDGVALVETVEKQQTQSLSQQRMAAQPPMTTTDQRSQARWQPLDTTCSSDGFANHLGALDISSTGGAPCREASDCNLDDDALNISLFSMEESTPRRDGRMYGVGAPQAAAGVHMAGGHLASGSSVVVTAVTPTSARICDSHACVTVVCSPLPQGMNQPPGVGRFHIEAEHRGPLQPRPNVLKFSLEQLPAVPSLSSIREARESVRDPFSLSNPACSQ